MKKLWIILGFFAVMMGFSVWEIVATRAFYRETVQILDSVESSFAAHADALDDPDNLAQIDRLETHWYGGRKLVLTFGNHTVLRNADERITALCEYARQNEYSDAMVSLRQTQRYVTDLLSDVYPSLTNLL